MNTNSGLYRFVRALVVALPMLLGHAAQERPALEVTGLSTNASFVFDEQTGVATDPVGVLVTYGDASLTARRIEFNRETADVRAEGDVRLEQGKELWTGDRIHYNFAARKMESDRFKAGMPPFFVGGDGVTADVTANLHTATNAFVTADDIAEPVYKIRAKSLKIIPGELIEARHATLYLGKVPVMYLPFYRRHLYRHPSNFVLIPGYRSLYGPYALGTYNWYASTNFDAAVHLDYRQKRGVAGGPDFNYDLGKIGQRNIETYSPRDEEPGIDTAGKPIRDDRQRLSFTHTVTIQTNLTAKVVVREQSDAQVVRDFFEREYRKDIQPNSFLEVNQLWPNFSLDLIAQPQFNDFFQTVERLPDIKLTGVRQQLGISPFYYESDSSVGYLRFRSADNAGTNYAAMRADTFHQIVLPQNYFGWLNVTPRVGMRFTHYGELEGEGSSLDAQDRGVFNTGAEVSTKASRIWNGARSRLWDVTELRHIVEPSINYVYVPTPNREPSQLPQFDSELRSLRLLPVDYPDYNSIDSIDSQNVFRLGLRNKLQTKRKDEIDNVLNWAVYTDWRVKPRPDQSTFADVYSDFDLKPRSWMTFNSETRFDIGSGVWRMANHTLTLEPNETWSWKVGHRYLREDPGFGPLSGNNLFLSSLYYRFNENWGMRVTHHFEARDGRMEEQYYTLYRDLRSWTTALTLRFRDNRAGRDDVTIAITFSLKAFPRYGRGRDRNEPSLLLGG